MLQLSLRKNHEANSSSAFGQARMRNVAVFMLTWFLVIGFHALTHVHKICLEHGEWLEITHTEGHSESSTIHDDPEDRKLSLRGLSEVKRHLKHIHCPSLSGLRQCQVKPALELFFNPEILLSQNTVFDRHVLVSTISLLRIAQKTSPPSSPYKFYLS